MIPAECSGCAGIRQGGKIQQIQRGGSSIGIGTNAEISSPITIDHGIAQHLEFIMKATGLIFLGLCLLPAGVLVGHPGLFGVGAALLLVGNIKLLASMRAPEITAPMGKPLGRHRA